MKKTILLIFLAFVISFANAQEEDIKEKRSEIETLFGKPTKVRGYVAPFTNMTTIADEAAYLSGVTAGGIFNDHFIFGFYQVDLENDLFSSSTSSTIDFEHKGLWLGYIFMPKRIIHFNTNVQLGKGTLDIYNDNLNIWIDDDLVFVVNPSLEVEFNIAKFFRVGVGANYRFAFDVDKTQNYFDSDFTDFGVFASFKFGWFQ